MEGLENLISLLGANYEVVRFKLIKYFEWQACIAAEDLTDETIDRVATKIAQGVQINNLMGYFYGVARLVFKEYQRREAKERRAFATLPTSTEEVGSNDEAATQLTGCRQKCFKELSEADHNLIVAYCKPDGCSKKERREALASTLGIKIENLRLKAFRIRVKLNDCLTDCLKNAGERK
jgi:DNA-directed RNA polymerase specialized sigma24 family protein